MTTEERAERASEAAKRYATAEWCADISMEACIVTFADDCGDCPAELARMRRVERAQRLA